jgi:hypothetical protein
MTATVHAPRPPEGDWLGTPFLKFERQGPFGVVTLDRPKARNAMSPAMYFGIGYAVNHVAADDDLAGLIITGTGDVFAPGGDLGGAGGDDWMNFGSLPMEALLPFDTLRTSRKPVVSAVNGLAQGGGLQIAMCCDMAVVSDRATFRVPELYRGIADTYYSHMLARLIGPVRHARPHVHRPHPDRGGGRRLGHRRPARPARRVDEQRARGARPVLAHRAWRPGGGQVQPGQLPGSVRPDRDDVEPWWAGGNRRIPGVQGASLARLGTPRPAHRWASVGKTAGQLVGLSTSCAMASSEPEPGSMVWVSTTRLRVGDNRIDR